MQTIVIVACSKNRSHLRGIRIGSFTNDFVLAAKPSERFTDYSWIDDPAEAGC